MTELGQRQALQDALTQNHGKQWGRAKAPVVKARAEARAKHAALVVKPADPANAIGDWEIRTWFNAKNIGPKLATAVSTKDLQILHALLLKPELCGLEGLPPILDKNGRPVPIIDHLKERYNEMVYPTELAELEAMEAVIVPAEQACGMAYNELRSTLDALQETLDPKAFVRINRGTLVRLDAIRELLPWFHGEYKVVLHDNTELRWSRRYISQRPELLKQR